MSNNPQLQIITGKYFTNGLIYGALAVIVGSVSLISTSPILAGVLLFVSLLVISTNCCMEFRADSGVYKEYLSTLGIRHSIDQFNLQKPEVLMIDSTNYSQILNSRGSTTTLRFEKFNGYIIRTGNDPIHILSSKKKGLVAKKLKTISILLDLEIIDNS